MPAGGKNDISVLVERKVSHRCRYLARQQLGVRWKRVRFHQVRPVINDDEIKSRKGGLCRQRLSYVPRSHNEQDWTRQDRLEEAFAGFTLPGEVRNPRTCQGFAQGRLVNVSNPPA